VRAGSVVWEGIVETDIVFGEISVSAPPQYSQRELLIGKSLRIRSRWRRQWVTRGEMRRSNRRLGRNFKLAGKKIWPSGRNENNELGKRKEKCSDSTK